MSKGQFMVLMSLGLWVLTLITPAVVQKWYTLFEIMFWNNFAWLNICCAPYCRMLHTWRGRSFDINFYKVEQPWPLRLQVCTTVCIIYDAHMS